MKIVKVKVYTYDELDADAQTQALDNFSIGYPDRDWYSDEIGNAHDLGIEIEEIDFYYCIGKFIKSPAEVAKALIEIQETHFYYCTGKFIESPAEVAKALIEHGCATQAAQDFLHTRLNEEAFFKPNISSLRHNLSRSL